MDLNEYVLWKLASQLATPFPLASIVLVLGCALMWRPRTRDAGRLTTTAGVLALLLLAYGVPFTWLARYLEDHYRAVTDVGSIGDIRWIVVLGAGHFPAADLPVNSRLGTSALQRVVEAVRLHRALPGSRILFSGGAGFDAVPHARETSAASIGLGVSPADIVIEPRPQTTAEEISCIARALGNERFLLVTTAIHMPRAMKWVRRNGLQAVASPADYRTRAARGEQLLSMLPSAGAIALSTGVFHELAALGWMQFHASFGTLPPRPGPCNEH